MASSLLDDHALGERPGSALPTSFTKGGYGGDVADRAGSLSAGTSMRHLDEVFTTGGTAEAVKRTAEAMLEAAARSGDDRIKVLGLCKAADALAMTPKPTQQNADEAMAKVKEAKALCEDIDDFEAGEAAVSYAMARAHMRFGGTDEDIQDKALDFGSDAAYLCQTLGCKRGEASSLMVVGDSYHATKDQAKAVEYHKKAMAVFKEMGDQSSVGFVYNKLAEDYFKIKPDLKKATNHVKRALVIFQEARDPQEEANSWHLLSQIQGAAKDIEGATDSVRNARNLCQFLKDHTAESKAMESLVKMFVDNDLQQEGIKLAKEMVTVNHEAGDRNAEAEALLTLAEHLCRNYEFVSAEKVCISAEELFKSVRNQEGIKMAQRLKEHAVHGQQSEKIEFALGRHQHVTHMPSPLIVDPGRQKRLQDKFNAFAKSA